MHCSRCLATSACSFLQLPPPDTPPAPTHRWSRVATRGSPRGGHTRAAPVRRCTRNRQGSDSTVGGTKQRWWLVQCPRLFRDICQARCNEGHYTPCCQRLCWSLTRPAPGRQSSKAVHNLVLTSSEYQLQLGVILQNAMHAALSSARVASMKTPSQKPGRSHCSSLEPITSPMVLAGVRNRRKRINILEPEKA